MPDLQPMRRQDFPGGTVCVYPRHEAEQVAAGRFVDLIRSQKRTILGLATGSTPIAVYQHLVQVAHHDKLSFRSVTTYNLDEYYPMSPSNPQSYRAFMDQHLFRHVDLPANQTHLLDGTIPEDYVNHHVRNFDQWIEADGGIDLQLLGLGRNGHIGFNEPAPVPVDVALGLPTRLVDLHPTTRTDAIKDFGAESQVPRQALTLGIASILAARSILVLAFGSSKADAVARSLMGPVTGEVPGSLLQTVASKVTWLLDPDAAARLF